MLLLSVFGQPASGVEPRTVRVNEVFSLQDNELIILKGALVQRVIGQYAFISSTSGSQLLPVYTQTSVQSGWTILIIGHTATVSAKRIVVAEQIKLYADNQGRPYPPLPYDIYISPNAPNTIELTSQTLMESTPDETLPPPPDPSKNPEGGSSLLFTFTEGTISWAKSQEDGTQITLGTEIQGEVVTRVWADHFYIEEDNRSCGIKVVKTAHNCNIDDRAYVTGTIQTDASTQERYINATTVTPAGSGHVNPLGLNNKWLGGGDFAYVADPPISGQRGITGASGLNNIGLLVRTWGKVTELDTANPAQWFRIDDGSNVQTTVASPPFAYSLNDYACISGISSCEVDTNGDLHRVLRPQPLTCTINQAAEQVDPTNTSPIDFTVTFSEPVTGFTEDDVTVTGVEGATKTVTGSGATYNVAVCLPAAGTVVATVPAGVVQNSSGVWNYATTYTDNSVLFDDVLPTISNASVTPIYSTGSFTITYTTSDTGGSGINKVKLWGKVGGEYQYTEIDSTTGTFELQGPEGNYDLALTAVDNAGNESALTALPQVIIDTTLPSAPTNVVLDLLIYYTGGVHATWDASTDSGSGIKDYLCMLQRRNPSTGVWEDFLGWLTDGNSDPNITFYVSSFGYSLTFGNYYRLRVTARDNAGNWSQSTAVLSQEQRAWTSKVGFLHYLSSGAERDKIHTWLQALYTAQSSYITYTQMTQFPSTQDQLNQYNTIFVAFPSRPLNSTELSWLTAFINGFQKRLVMVGEYNPWGSTQNGYLNSLVDSLGMNARFSTNSSSYPRYDDGISTQLSCPVDTTHYLMGYVSSLGDSACSEIQGAYSSSAHVLARTRLNYSPARPWIVEEDLPTAGSRILVQDTDLFNSTYRTVFGNWQFVFNLCTTYRR